MVFTDYAIFQKLTEVFSSSELETPAKGVFAKSNEAFRAAEFKYGESLTLPIFSMFWNNVKVRQETFNRPLANRGEMAYVPGNMNESEFQKFIPVTVSYELVLYYPTQAQLIQAMEELNFFIVSKDGGHVTFDMVGAHHPDVEVQLSFADVNFNIDRSEEQNVGKYYTARTNFVAQTWMFKAKNITNIRKIIGQIYVSEVDADTPFTILEV